MLTQNAKLVLKQLCEVGYRGPIAAVGHGSAAVGMTLLGALGIQVKSSEKPSLFGVVVSARRSLATQPRNRVNLFAKVPDWRISACKSSREIAERFGYDAEPGLRKLYCSVSARHSNSQGLSFRVNHASSTLDEVAKVGASTIGVARWHLSDLKDRLAKTHPESIWVVATTMKSKGTEYFHYRKAVYTAAPYVERLEMLLSDATVTMDHLIEVRDRSTTEKGPLFKIAPSNLPLLFPASMTFDLLTSELPDARV